MRMRSRQKLFDKQGGLCFYCGRKMIMGKRVSKDDLPFLLTKDHIIPRSKGGTSDESNIVGACYRCNTAKGAIDADCFTSGRVRAALACREMT
jgi:5-methylcytosine-specific restriction endonuclease McrA